MNWWLKDFICLSPLVLRISPANKLVSLGSSINFPMPVLSVKYHNLPTHIGLSEELMDKR